MLVPVRDEARYLAEALASLAAQTLADIEVIVVDDGSVDGSAEIAEAHAGADRRFRVVRQTRRGLVPALERGRAEARGRYLARMDGDDVALPERLEVQVVAIESERLAACGGGVEYLDAATVTDGAGRYASWLNSLVTVETAARDVFVECPIVHPTLVARRESIAAVGGYRDPGWPEDYDLVLRLWAASARFRNVDRVVLRWRDEPDRLSRTGAAYTLDAFVRCKVHHLRRTLLAGRDAIVWGAGPVGKSFARELIRQGTAVCAFVDVDPRKIGHSVYGARVVPVEEAPRFGDAFALGAVAGEAARARIRRLVAEQGRQEGRDFVAVA